MMKQLTQFYKPYDWYSITLNPIDKHQYFGKENRYQRFRSFVYEQFFELKCAYTFKIEISEPRGMKTQGYNGPRLHLHGRIRFKNNKEVAKFLLDTYYKLLRWTSVDIDSIEDIVIWDAYCDKQRLWKKDRLSNETTDIKYIQAESKQSVDD